MTVAQTSIDCYYNKVVKFAPSQNERVMAVVQPGRDYSLCELMQLTNTDEVVKKMHIDKSSMSRVVNGLRATDRLVRADDRKCTVSGVTITPSKLPAKQLALLS